ncbi:uncharacterized protein LOC129570727 [Sitodiplosis mosellana]|uniref:uncharacterized protein LOC129570727 n=1 Tax=Sitodiplosis mosellana TaxID=263140 RepID=UPI002443CD9A|nr:uncharacterized protein LOC129570727 [Sitodiplosis mosellana]
MKTMLKLPQNTTGTDVPSIDTKNESPKKEEPLERILTVDIKTMRTHMRNDNFNNHNTLLEFFPKIHQISRPNERTTCLTLRCADNIHVHTMQANFYGDMRPFQTGDVVRCVGHLNGQTGQFKIINMSKIDYERELDVINRLIAISSFELAKLPIKTPNQSPKK